MPNCNTETQIEMRDGTVEHFPDWRVINSRASVLGGRGSNGLFGVWPIAWRDGRWHASMSLNPWWLMFNCSQIITSSIRLHSECREMSRFVAIFTCHVAHSQRMKSDTAAAEVILSAAADITIHNELWVRTGGLSDICIGLSKRNGAKLRESFCPAAASHSRPRQSGA